MKKYFLSICITAVLAAAVIAQPEVIIHHRINANYESANRVDFAPTAGGTGAVSPVLANHGGPVIGTPVIYIIWYGDWNNSTGSDTPAGQQIVRDWANGIGGSPYFAINTTYGSPISGNVSWSPGNETTEPNPAKSLSDSGVLASVSSAITSGRLPYDANGIYFVITSSNVRKSGFCTSYCGWHTAGNTSTGQHIRYSFVGNADRCLSACAAQTISPNGNAGVDGAVSVLSHELEEATTDPDLNAWYDSKGAENADKCAWTFGQTLFQTSSGAYYNQTFGGRNWLIQRNLLKSGSSWFCMLDSGRH